MISRQQFEIAGYEAGAHVNALDGVRGLAVLLVLCFHFFGLGFGWVGVDLFFVLSGFLITGILLDQKGKKNYFRNFYARRTLRIFPLYYAALCIFFLLLALTKGLSLKQPDYFISHAPWFFLYMQNWLFGIYGWPADHALNHFWSLAIEEQFYLFWPFIIYYLPEKKVATVSLLLILLSLVLRIITFEAGIDDAPFQYTVTFCRLDGLCLGALIAVLIRNAPHILSSAAPWIFIITIPVSLLLYGQAQTLKFDHPLYLTFGYTVFDLFWAGIVILCFTKGFSSLRKFFQTDMMKWLGRYSYGIYVYHWMIHELLMPYYEKHYPSPDSFSVYKYIYGLICLAFTLFISKISFDYFELRVLRLKKHFSH